MSPPLHEGDAGRHDLTGTTLAHFRVLERIGAGGMGIVYRAHDQHLDRDVALKVLNPGIVVDERARRQFHNEAKSLSRLSHAGIQVVYDFDSQADVDFLVTEYIPGETLDQIAPGALSEERVLELGTQLADALRAAHEQGVLHRDLKPGNLRVTPAGRLKILDFGLAKFLTPPDQTLTMSGSETMEVVGTLSYMAPEQLLDGRYDERSDLWSVGVVLFELATGQRPFAARGTAAAVEQILHRDPPGVRELRPEFSRAFEQVVLKCLEKDPRRRTASAAELLADLRAVAHTPPHRSVARQLWRAARRWRTAVLAATLILLAALGWGTYAVRHRPQPAAAVIRSIAVLPLEDLSRGAADEFFADGMTDALIAELSKVGALHVISRTSAMHYKHSSQPIPQIARELHVDAVVEGTVVRDNQDVRITVALVSGVSDRQLWTATYDRELRGVLRLQSEVARAITGEIQVQLTPEEERSLSAAADVQPQAHEAVLRGRYLWNQQSETSVRQAMQQFEQAAALDDNYAPAYAGLADSYIVLTWAGSRPVPAADAYPKARAAASRALQLDPTLAGAHASLALVLWRYDWDWARADQEFRAALKLNPSFALAYQWYGLFLASMGRKTEAEDKMRTALSLDPASMLASANAAWAYYFGRQYDLALRQAQSTVEFWPDSAPAHWHVGLDCVQRGELDRALEEFNRAIALSGRVPYLLASLGHVQALRGQRAQAQRALAELSRHPQRAESLVAQVHLGLGDRDAALRWLETAHAQRDPYMVFLNVDPVWDPLRADPRFRALLASLHFAP